jgi:hypothetical protein
VVFRIENEGTPWWAIFWYSVDLLLLNLKSFAYRVGLTFPRRIVSTKVQTRNVKAVPPPISASNFPLKWSIWKRQYCHGCQPFFQKNFINNSSDPIPTSMQILKTMMWSYGRFPGCFGIWSGMYQWITKLFLWYAGSSIVCQKVSPIHFLTNETSTAYSRICLLMLILCDWKVNKIILI